MPVEMAGVETVTVPLAQAVDFARRAFAAAGVPEADALKAATALVDADLHGVSTHGVKNLAGYVRAVRSGQANARPEIRVTGGSGALCQMSGGGGLGHVAAHHGMEQAIRLAREYGVGCVFMRESNHYGASGYWARLAVEAGMAGFAVTNAGASIAPWGGTVPVVGNNPPAWAVPGGAGPDDAIFLDMALSVVAGNRLDIYRRRGQPIPPGWALDKDGQPATAPGARAAGGSLAPMGGYKGVGLALMLSLFTSLLADGAFDDETNDPNVEHPGRSHWFMAIDVARLVPLETFTHRAARVAAQVRQGPRRADVDRLYAPGEIEQEFARRQRETGIAYESFIFPDLKELADSLGIQYDLPG
jgi:LDH2 family malate/lactate/ureidoglycolate dehydrogenase